jgi:8-oxo-dGTP pyrophosphatase MutT (NUDIX family)
VPKTKLKSKSVSSCQQYAALPIRFSPDGQVQVLLATSRGTGRWVIPKGWPAQNLAPSAAAAREAYEEAGLEGEIQDGPPIGRYSYNKQLNGRRRWLDVDVFLMRVSRQLASWPEQAERETAWFTPDEAANEVAEPELAAIFVALRNILRDAS